MPILGPNCYGFVNAVDRALLWPDQHGLVPVERGVAILTQSSNIAINLTMQARGLPIGYIVTAGNQAQVGQAEIAMGLLDDPRPIVMLPGRLTRWKGAETVIAAMDAVW